MCKPSDMRLPTAKTCANVDGKTVAPNFKAWQNQFWGKCGHDDSIDSEYNDQAYNFYCTHP